MMLSALLIACLAQAPQPQWELHPSDKDLYLAIPDAQSLLDALDRTPSTRFMESAKMQALLELLPGERWGGAESIRTTLATQVGLPGLESSLLELRGASLSAHATSESTELLLLLDFSTSESAERFQGLLAEEWGATLADSPRSQALQTPPGTGLWTCSFPGPQDLPIWIMLLGHRVAIGAGQASALDLLRANQRTQDGESKASHPKLQQELKASGLAGSGSAASLWWVHRTDPLQLLGRLDAKHRLLGGLLGERSLRSGLAAKGVARLDIRAAGYAFDGFTPERPSKPRSVQPRLIERVSSKAMLLWACRPNPTLIYDQLKSWMRLGGVPMERLVQRDGEVQRLLRLLADDALVYSQPINSTSPPKSFLSIALRPGEGATEQVLQACTRALESLSGLSVAQRDYRVKNRATRERHIFAVHTLVIPEDPGRGPLTPSISPSFAVAGDRLLLSPRAMHLKNELRRLYDGKTPDEEWIGPLGTRGLVLPEGAQSVLLFDWADQLATLINFLPLLAIALPDLPFGAEDLPGGEELKRAFPPLFGYSRALENGTLYHYQSAVGLDLLQLGLRLYPRIPDSVRSLLPF